jgi:hypothetical protein
MVRLPLHVSSVFSKLLVLPATAIAVLEVQVLLQGIPTPLQPFQAHCPVVVPLAQQSFLAAGATHSMSRLIPPTIPRA